MLVNYLANMVTSIFNLPMDLLVDLEYFVGFWVHLSYRFNR